MVTEFGNSPLYTKVEIALAADIATAVLPCGSQLPSENSLVERFEVSRTTVRVRTRT